MIYISLPMNTDEKIKHHARIRAIEYLFSSYDSEGRREKWFGDMFDYWYGMELKDLKKEVERMAKLQEELK
jgi:hypothetical protein